MKYLLLLFLIFGCSSTKLKESKCAYSETFWDHGRRYIVYQCKMKPPKGICHIIRDYNDSYQCIYQMSNGLDQIR